MGARTSVDQIGMVSASMSSSNGGAVASSIQSMTAASQSFVTPTGMTARALALLPMQFPKPTVVSATTGTAECTATMCTFTNYGDDSPSGWKTDGTIKVTGDRYVYDLTYDVTSPGSSLRWLIDSDLTTTATSIDGTMHNVGDTVGEGYDVSWDVAVDFTGVVLDGARCPTGGSIRASGQGYSPQGTVTFGPACGDAN